MKKAATSLSGLLVLSLLVYLPVQLSHFRAPEARELLAPGLPALAANLFLLLLPLALLRALLTFRWLAALAVPGALAFAYLNARKISFLNESIGPFDLLQVQLEPLLFSFLGPGDYLAVAVLAFVPLCLGWLLLRRRNSLIVRPARFLPVFAAAALALGVWGAGRDTFGDALLALFPHYGPGRQLEAARLHGFALAGLAGLERGRLRVPENYSRELVARLLPAADPGRPPGRDVVIVQLESFVDVRKLGLRLHGPFAPGYARIARESRLLPLISPVTGGTTANAEFEALTGIPMATLPHKSVPYVQYLRRATPSLAHAFAAAGYETIAMHPNTPAFWNRGAALPFLGFSQTLFRDQLALSPRSPPDAGLFSASLSRLRRQPRKPELHFLITLDTHAPYEEHGEVPTLLAAPPLPAATERAANIYLQRMATLDRQLSEFFEALRALPKPPLLVLYGDHQPYFLRGSMNQAHPQAPYWVEALVWTGARPGPGEENDLRELYCLGPEVLETAGVGLPPYQKFLRSYCDAGNARTPEAEAALKVLSYDRLFGEQYSAGK